MSGFDSIIGQGLAVRLLQTFLRNGTLPHALLFTGNAGVGKRKTASIVAMALNCSHLQKSPKSPSTRSNPCGACRSCRQIMAHNHPDVQHIESHGESLKIDQIRQITRSLAMKTFGESHRVVIVAEAHRLTTEAANAMLKALEEPPERTTLILTANQRSDLLPTLVSRCRPIRFKPLKETHLVTLLMRSQLADKDQAESIAALSGGSFTQAKTLAQSRWKTQRDWLIHASGLDQKAKGVQQSIALSLAFAAQLSNKKTEIQDLLEMLKGWIRDLRIVPYQPDSAINRDKQALLRQVRQYLDDQKIQALWEAVERAQKDIAAKANLRLTLEIMALSMAGYLSCGNPHFKW